MGRSTQFRPVLDLNGGEVDGRNYAVTFEEGSDTSLQIVDDEVFITDEDIEPEIISITINITNAQLHASQEFLSLSQDAPEEVEVTGENTQVIVISAPDPSLSRIRDFFITTLLRLRYTNTADEPGGEDRFIEFTIFDGRLTNDPIAVTTISIVEINDVPVVDLNGDNEGRNRVVEYTEADPPKLLIPQATLQDPDSSTLTKLTIEFTPFDVGNESLAFDLSVLPSGSTITCNESPCNGTDLELSGTAPKVEYQNLLRTLSYVNVKQPKDLPNLRDRVITVQVNDGESLSESGTEILIDFLANQSRVIIQLDVPNQDFFTEYTEGQSESISAVGSQIRIVDTSLETLQSVDLTIRSNLPGGVREAGEEISINTAELASLEIGIEIHTILKRITFSGEAPIEDYLTAIRNVRYRNTEDEPHPTPRFIDVVVDPGGGAPQDTAFTNISIININDHSPLCNPEFQSVSIREDITPDSLIYTLIATDADVGVGASVSYAQVEGNGALFSTSSSGGVSLIDTVDFESIKDYSIVVQACDDGIIPNQFCCNFTLQVNITDFNDEKPIFLQEAYTFSVVENSVTNISTFSITDGDSGTNAEIVELTIDTDSYIPVSGCVGLFSVSANPPSLSTVAPGLDYEMRTSCQFNVIATDGGGTNALTGSAVITVNIENEDDFPPEFSMDLFTFSVEEDNSFPQSIGSVEANDIDSSSFRYSLQNADGFDVNATSGEITINFSADYDVATNYTFECVATDPNMNSATVEVIVSINPINNDPPTLDLNATDSDSNNALTPVTFTEESSNPVTFVSDPIITDPDQVTLIISEIRAWIANSDNPSQEELSVLQSATSLFTDISPADGSILVVAPTNPTQLNEVYEVIQSIQYMSYEDEISSCNSSRYQCVYGSNSRTILIQVRDGINYSPQREMYVVFETVNDPPELDLNTNSVGTGHRTVFQEGQGPVNIVNVGFVSLTDDDDNVLTSLTCNLSNPVDGTAEFLALTEPLPSELAATISTDGYTVVISGNTSTVNYITAISSIKYNSTTRNPTNTLRYINCYASDGMEDSNIAVAEITFNTTNEIPALDLDSLTPTVNYTTNFVEEGGVISIVGDVVLSDQDDTTMSSLVVTLTGASSPQETVALNSAYTLPPELTEVPSTTGFTISGLAPTQMYREVILNVIYNNTATEISDITGRLVEFIVEDEGGAESSPAFTTISITPVDDNPPAFAPVSSFSIFENSIIGTEVGRVEIIDSDQPSGSDVPTFSIASASTPSFGTTDFYIVNNPENPYEAVIYVSASGVIDYELRTPSYSLVVLAASGNFNTNTTVMVLVTNLPDVEPMFTLFPESGVFEVFENEDIGIPLSPPQVMAIDPDGLDTIMYDISGNEIGGVPLIDIDSTTGNLTVVGNINREIHGSEFQVTIVARDSNSMTQRTATVEIHGVNEFPPTFSAPSYPVIIEENAEPSLEPITTVSATDVDDIPSEEHNITYLIRQGSGSHLFDINSTSGEVFQLSPVDYEEFSNVTLTVVASDNDYSPSPQTSTALVEVSVGNVNDEAPFFNNLPTALVISELTPQHSTVFTVEFGDPDINSDLRFTSLASDIFTLNTENGELTVLITSLDADMGQLEYMYLIELTDESTDSAFSSLSSISAQLNITIEDRNDIIPVFSSDNFEGEVMENLDPGQSVLQVVATDGDYGFTSSGNANGNNRVEYLLGSDAPDGVFAINRDTGIITTNITLNREEQDHYIFTVIAQDAPVNEHPNFHTTQVRIDVIDENEHAPEADPSQYYIFVEENTQSLSLQTFASSQWSTQGMHF